MNYLTHLFPGAPKTLETSLLLPLRNVVLMPGITLPVVAGRSRSVAVVEATALTPRKELVIATVRPEALPRLNADENAEIESLEEIYPVATLAVIQRIIHLPVGGVQLIVQGKQRVRLEQMQISDRIVEVKFQRLPLLTKETAITFGSSPTTIEALTGAIKSLWREIAAVNPNLPEEVLDVLLDNDDPVELAYQTSMLLPHDVEKLQSLLEQNNLEVLLQQVVASLKQEVEVQRLRGEILGETKKEIDQQQREFFLRQQLKKIQQELGEGESETQEIQELRSQLEAAQLPETAYKQAKRELARLERVGSSSAEGGVIRTYLDWLLEMPWNKTVQDNLDLQNARAVLDTDHHGLVKVKDRIIEHLATFKLKSQQSKVNNQQDLPISSPPHPPISPSSEHYTIGTVLCFVGPPGVGKTSLGRSIARALGRPFERVSLGGLRDEAELRGHRRTYIGAMPGRIVQALHRSGVKNPAIMLDELDKVGMDYRGDPASVLLEILDPQQNYCFRDLYLDLDFDLSQVFFIGTANDLSKVPAPLLDRLEIIELSGYSEEEKLAIAQKYLLPRQLEKAGLPSDAVQILPETLRLVIECYTREAGVRRLEQQLGTICRKLAVRHAEGKTEPMQIHPEQLEDLLGPKIFLQDEMRKTPRPGVATGLAWTLAGGEVLFVEAVQLPQGKELVLTGQLGEIMEESAHIAYSYVWANAASLGIDTRMFRGNGLHIHVPAGAVPKDGPSAGVTMLTAIASLLTKRSVRTDTAMTGEINLSGEVLPIGGVREKVLAARRVGIKRILLPQQNAKDLVDVPEDVRNEMEFIFCDRIEQVLENALLPPDDSQRANTNENGHQQPALAHN
ncbi:MAG: endopeptidase La [Fischerella sp.]|jgi:ATP-dependent Lon protease|uniref:endopeptidase La n=1 Tax=Fischerella sp. TaxID=1191 RepID=UPI00182DA35E|nr:endopeptidase La [Fischerella sp.]NWF59794.1 endopeptidase La [Fischerella sp.]